MSTSSIAKPRRPRKAPWHVRKAALRDLTLPRCLASGCTRLVDAGSDVYCRECAADRGL